MSAIQRVSTVGIGGFLILALALAVGTPAQGPTTGSWEKAAPFPEVEEELYAAAANGKMYIEGGFGAGGHPVRMMWEYNPGADKWTKKKSMPTPAHHAAITEFHGKLYILGGGCILSGSQSGLWRMGTNRQRMGIRSRCRFVESACADAHQARLTRSCRERRRNRKSDRVRRTDS